jgi:calpain-15
MPAGGGAGAGGSQRQEAVRLPLPSFFAQEREAARRREEIVASLRAAEAAGEEARFIDYGFLEDMLRGTGYEGALALRAPRAIRTQSGREVAWRLFGDRISPFDVVQGSLGDCYLLSAFVVLAERPDLIQNLFLDVSVSRYGLYQLRFFKDGHWRIVDIDDMLPVRDVGSHKSLVFAHNEEGLLWPALLEKGYAKLHGSYGSIHAGQMHEALADLTGVPCDRLSLHAVDLSSEADVLLLWGQVLSLRESGALMGASCGRLDGRLSRDERIDSHMYRDMGLLPDHAYAVLDVRQLSERHRLIKLRNPWSRWVWNGDWGPGSKLWTPELRAQLGYFTVASDDRGNDSGGRAPRAGETDRGVFWMRFEDFLNFFSNIDFCRFRMDWHTQLFDGRFPASSLVSDQRWEVRTSRPTWAFFSLIQRDLRTLRRVGKPPAPGAAATLCDEYSAVGLVVCRVRASQSVEDETLEFHAWRCLDAKREVTCEVMLHDPDSVYVVFAVGIATPRERAEARTFVLSSYSARPLTIAQLPTTARLGARGLQLAVKQHCRSLEALNEARTVILYRHVEPGCVLLYVENRDYGSHTNLELDCSASAGLQSSRSELLSIDVIPPRHAQLLALFVPLGRTAGFSWRCSFKFSLLQAQRATASALQQHYPPFAVDDDPHRPLPLLLML